MRHPLQAEGHRLSAASRSAIKMYGGDMVMACERRWTTTWQLQTLFLIYTVYERNVKKDGREPSARQA